MRSKGIHLSLALVASLGAVSLVGCGGGDNNSERVAQTVDASKNTVTKVAIATNDQYVHFKSFYQFELIGSDAQGNEVNLTKKATWKISDSKLGKIKDGYFTASGTAGNFTLSAEYAGIVAAPQEINVSDANLVKVTVQNTAASVDECKNTTFTAQAEFDNGRILPYPLTWKVAEGGTNAVFKDATKGTLNTTNSGAIKVVASGVDNSGKEVLSAAYDFAINEALTRITVTPSKTTELRNGDTATVTVQGIYGDQNNPVDITGNAALTASPDSLLKIEGTKITAQNGTANGSKVTLKGSCGGAEGTHELTIKDRELKSIEIRNSNGGASSNLTVAEGSNIDLNVRATYIDDATNDDYTSNVFWKIDDRNNNIPADSESKITITSSGVLSVASDLNLGISAIIYVIAEVRDSSGNVLKNSSGTEIKDEINITINPN